MLLGEVYWCYWEKLGITGVTGKSLPGTGGNSQFLNYRCYGAVTGASGGVTERLLVLLGRTGLTWGKTEACEVSVAAGTGVAGDTTSTLRFCGDTRQSRPLPPSKAQSLPVRPSPAAGGNREQEKTLLPLPSAPSIVPVAPSRPQWPRQCSQYPPSSP